MPNSPLIMQVKSGTAYLQQRSLISVGLVAKNARPQPNLIGIKTTLKNILK